MNNRFLVRGIDEFGSSIELLVPDLVLAQEQGKSLALDGWSVEIIPVSLTYVNDLTNEAANLVQTIGPTYH